MELNNLHKIYFLGIGGIGMSALARYFNELGVEIHGYDRISTPLSRRLESEGIQIHYEEDTDQIPAGIDLVIITPAIPNDHKELQYFRQNRYTIRKRSEVLGLLSADKFTIAVAGTHGKTSITSIIAHIFKTAGEDFSAFVGGVCKNYHSNYISHGEPQLVIVEADEYDRSFLRLNPDIAIVTSMDADHLDIYDNRETLEKTFKEFAGHIKKNGQLIHKSGLKISGNESVRTAAYGIEASTHTVTNIRIEDGCFHFDIQLEDRIIQEVSFGIPGRHNIENALAASLAAYNSGISPGVIKQALRTYRGVERRFDFRIRDEKLVFIDDYAHHPEELMACISAVKELYPDKKICGIFQPHLYSRTRDFAGGFAQSLQLLDEVILLDIYPAREKPIEGVSSGMILEKITGIPKSLHHKADFPQEIEKHEFDILLTLGAGDIDQLVEPLEKQLVSKFKLR